MGRAGTRGLSALALIASLVASLAVSTWTLAPLQPATAASNSLANTSAGSLAGTSARNEAVGPPAMSILDQLLNGPPPGDVAGSGLDAGALDAAIAYAADRDLVGLAVLDRQTGRYVDNGVGARTAMGSASIVKVLIAEELLHRAALGQIALGASEYARIEAMLVYSDDPAASSLYSQFGDVSLIQSALARHGLTQSSPPADPQYWGNGKFSAHDVARFYGNIANGSLPASGRDYLLGLLRSFAPFAADGFDQIYGVAAITAPDGAGPNSPPAVKQGWMCCLDGVRNVHSTAVVGADDRYVVVILTQYSPELPWSYGQTTTTEVARLVLDELSS